MFKLIAIVSTVLVAVSEARPTTLPLIIPVNGTEAVPKTLPLVIPADGPSPVPPKTLPLVVPVTPSKVPRVLPIIEPVSPASEVKAQPMNKIFPPNIPKDPSPKNLPVIVPIDHVPKTFPIFDEASTPSRVPKVLPIVVPVTPAKVVPRVLPIIKPVNSPTPVPKTLPLVVPKDTVPKTLPLIDPVVPTKVVPKVLPIIEPVSPSSSALEDKVQLMNIILPPNIPKDPNPKNLPVIVPVDHVPKTFPIFNQATTPSKVPKVLPIVVPVTPTQTVPKVLPIIEPVGSPSPVPKTLPLVKPLDTKPKILSNVVPVGVKPTTLPIVSPIRISDASNHLGLSLLKSLNKDNKNVFFSPFSLSTALAMLYSGAKGTTSQQMRQVLGFEAENLMDFEVLDEFSHVLKDMKEIGVKNNGNSLDVANKMVVQKGSDVLESFKDNLKQTFDSSIDEVDFKDIHTVEEINDWVRKQTNNKIKKLLEGPMDPNTKLVLLNAIYFKGVFQTKFSEELTGDGIFFSGDNQQKSVKMMKRTGKFNFTEIPELDATMIEIPYTGHDFSLFVVLPNERQGMKRLTNDISDWSIIEESIDKLQEHKVEVTLPKFKLETSYSMKDKLSSMGMSSVFSPSADLSGIDGRQDLEVGEVVHKAFIEINEEGTEAAAVTGIRVGTMAIPQPMIPEFRADHSFMFFIRDNIHRMNMFIGQVNQL